MRYKISSQKTFKPFDITITIETLDDLHDMWLRANAGTAILKNMDSGVPVPPKPQAMSDLWEELGNILSQQ